MEGILEKPSRFAGKTTKVWSILDETTLSFFQENKRSSCIGSVALSDILSVNILQECQFEIVTDVNSQIYTAASQEQCKEWVEKLLTFTKSRTEGSQSTTKTISVFLEKNGRIDGEHTVPVKTAKNIFEANTSKIGALEKSPSDKNYKVHVEPIKVTRKSDPNKVQPWSTIEDARSHLNHIDRRNSCIKTDQGLNMENLSSQLHMHENIEHPTKPDDSDFKTTINNNINNKIAHTQQQRANKELKRSSNVDHTGIHQNNSEFPIGEAEKQLISKAPQNVEPSSETRPESGYRTRIGETSQNSHDNKIDDEVFQTSYSDLEAELVVTKQHGSSKSSKDTNDFAEVVSEEVSQTPVNAGGNAQEHVVTMRKSRSRVSVSQDNVVTVIPDGDLAFPNTRRSKKPLSSFENDEKKELPRESSLENTNFNENKKKPSFFTENEEPVRITAIVTVDTVNEKFCDISQDHLDGDLISVDPVAIVENYLDIDKIMSNANFPNIPALPNSTPNRSDLVSFHELRNTLNNANSSEEYSDVDEVPDYDPIEQLSMLVDF